MLSTMLWSMGRCCKVRCDLNPGLLRPVLVWRKVCPGGKVWSQASRAEQGQIKAPSHSRTEPGCDGVISGASWAEEQQPPGNWLPAKEGKSA